MVDVISDFLANKKEEFLQKRIASELKGKKNQDNNTIAKARAKFQAEAEEKYDIKEWLKKVIDKATPNITTHPPKFTNPKITNDTSSVIFYGEYKNDGYVKTGNAALKSKIDVSANSATNAIIFEFYHLLSQNTNHNNKMLIDLFQSDEPELKVFIKNLALDYEVLKAKSAEIFFGKNSTQTTHQSIRQIYFPVDESYHLLSITTASMLLFEIKGRIDIFDKWIDGKHIRTLKKDNRFHPEGFDELPNLTEIGFSHADPIKRGNVSYLNSENKGIAYLLPSTPPTLQKRDIRLPTYDFFKNSLWHGQFKDNFDALHKLMILDINNINIREAINSRIKFVIDQILEKAFVIRASNIGWSETEHYKQLPLAQRIWLDDIHLEQRTNQELWLEAVSRSFAGWIVHSYEASQKNNGSVTLSSTESSHIRQFVEEAISQDKEFF